VNVLVLWLGSDGQYFGPVSGPSRNPLRMAVVVDLYICIPPLALRTSVHLMSDARGAKLRVVWVVISEDRVRRAMLRSDCWFDMFVGEEGQN